MKERKEIIEEIINLRMQAEDGKSFAKIENSFSAFEQAELFANDAMSLQVIHEIPEEEIIAHRKVDVIEYDPFGNAIEPTEDIDDLPF